MSKPVEELAPRRDAPIFSRGAPKGRAMSKAWTQDIEDHRSCSNTLYWAPARPPEANAEGAASVEHPSAPYVRALMLPTDAALHSRVTLGGACPPHLY